LIGGSSACRTSRDPGVRPVFPPEVVISVKEAACELPYRGGVPLSRYGADEIAARCVEEGLVAQISGSTVWRWLHHDAIRPWQHRTWVFPRAPDFERKAARVLDLYHRVWADKPLTDDDFVVSADEKPSIQARIRIHESLPVGPKRTARIEHEYIRGGALTYIAAWDVHRARVFGRCEPRSGIQPFERLVAQVMAQEPYRSARRVFWILDNGSSHRGDPCVHRLRTVWPNVVPVHLPVHSSWLNQIEVYFSIIQRKVLTPNDFTSLDDVADRLAAFQLRYERTATPFAWKFTREALADLMRRLTEREPLLAAN